MLFFKIKRDIFQVSPEKCDIQIGKRANKVVVTVYELYATLK